MSSSFLPFLWLAGLPWMASHQPLLFPHSQVYHQLTSSNVSPFLLFLYLPMRRMFCLLENRQLCHHLVPFQSHQIAAWNTQAPQDSIYCEYHPATFRAPNREPRLPKHWGIWRPWLTCFSNVWTFSVRLTPPVATSVFFMNWRAG